jgi:hypothetical protein
MTRLDLLVARLLATFLAGVMLSGCATQEEVSVGGVGPAMQRVLNLDIRPFNDAFARVSSEPHVADRVDVVQGPSSDEPLTSRIRLVFDGQSYEEAILETTGSLPDCRICTILGRSTLPDERAVERFFVDTDAPFLNERSASAFRYASGPDTLVEGRILETIHVSAIDDDPRAGRYRFVTLYIDPLDETLAGIQIDARRDTFFIREGGRRTAFIDRTGGTPFPRHASIMQHIQVLMSRERVIHTEIRYSLDAGARSPS